jgi:SAM-dependent methyltransferase
MTIDIEVRQADRVGTVNAEINTNPVVSGIEQMMGLLKPMDGTSPVGSGYVGYVDVLGDQDAIGPHRGQQVFQRRFVTLVYEGLWRPLVSKFFLGLGGPNAEDEMRLTLDMLAVSPGDRVIDVGCGPGNYTRRLAAAAGDGLVIGIDASEVMVATAAKRSSGTNTAYMRADGCALPFEDGTFDAACSVGVIHMIERPMAALEEIVRVLAPGGRLAVATTCAKEGKPRRARAGLTTFAHGEVSGALRELGLVDIDQRGIGRGQFVSARKPEVEVMPVGG